MDTDNSSDCGGGEGVGGDGQGYGGINRDGKNPSYGIYKTFFVDSKVQTGQK